MTIKKMVLLSALTALSIVLNWLEKLLFPRTVLAVTGFKLGLANVVFLVVLLTSGLAIGWVAKQILPVILREWENR